MKRKSAQILSLLLSVCLLGTSPVYAEDFSSELEVNESSSPDSSEDDDVIADDEPDVSVDGNEDSFGEADVTLEESEEEETESADIGSDEENPEELFSAGEDAADLGEEKGVVAGILEESQEAVGYGRVVEADIPASDSVKTTCSFYTGSNLESQNYSVWSSTVDSYLTESPDGSLMRVEANVIDSGTLLIEYYDKKYNLQKTMTLQLSLPIFGAFYEDENYYYVLTGANNPDKDDTKEVYRLTRYSKEWKAQWSCSLFGENTKSPFSAGSARMTKNGNYMYVRTCHLMYNGHQANVTFSVNLTDMSVADKVTDVILKEEGYASHSFNQFIQVDNGTLLGSDHGDAYPRTIAVFKYPTDISEGEFAPRGLYVDKCKIYKMVEMNRSEGNNYTGYSQGGFEYSDSSYLIAGNKDADEERIARNVFISSVPKDGDTPTMHYFSDYAGTEDSAMTPQLIKTGSNSFVLLWSSNGYVYYTAVDGTGNQVGSTHKMPGNLSDCVPAVVDGKLIWYAWRNENTTFYEINLSDLSVNNAVRIVNGHHREFGTKVTDGHIDYNCKVCGDVKQYAVPTSVEYNWLNLGQYYNIVRDKSYLVSGNTYQVKWKYAFQNTDLEKISDFKITSSDTSILAVEQTYANIANLIPLKSGKVTITVQDTYNPAAVCKADIYVDTIDEGFVSFGQSQFTYDGTEHKVNINVHTALDDLKEGEDYKVSYEGDRTNAGTVRITVSGIGKFKGSVTTDMVIEPANIYWYGKTAISPENCRYNGLPQEPAVTVQYGDRLLVENKDYKVEYSDNIEAGSGKVTITGIGNYTGSSFYYFDIIRDSLSDSNISGSDTTPVPKPTATPKPAATKKPTPTPKLTAKPKTTPKPAAVKAPANTSSLSVKSKAKGKAAVSWKVVKGITSYQVQYSSYKNMKKAKTVTVKGSSKSTTLKKLKSRKYCYIRIRTVKKIGKKNYYSRWSKIKSVKVK